MREHPEIGSAVLMMEYASRALNEKVALYGERSLYQQLSEGVARNDELLTRFERSLDEAPFALYEVRRLYLSGRTKDCKTWHGKRYSSPRWWCRTKRSTACRCHHRAGESTPWCAGSDPRCRGEQVKGQAWRSVRTVWEGSRFDAEMTLLRWGRAAGARIRAGENSVIRRAHYLEAEDGYPSANAYLVAAPAGVEDKQRIAKKPDAGFEAKWTQVTGLTGTRWEPIRPLVASERDRSSGLVPVRSFGGGKGQRASHVELTA